MAENKLEPEHQIFIVQQLAVFERPKTIQKRLKAEFNIEISLTGIAHYNITNKDLSKEWKKIFNSTRNKFLKDSSVIPLAHKHVRLQKLQNMFDRAEDYPIQNTVDMRATLKHIAEEMGDAFTNKRELTGKDGESLAEPLVQAFGQFNKMLEKVYGDGADTNNENPNPAD